MSNKFFLIIGIVVVVISIVVGQAVFVEGSENNTAEVNGSNISSSITSNIIISGFDENRRYDLSDSLNISCYGMSNNPLVNVTLYSNISGIEKSISSYSGGIFGEVVTGNNLTISFNNPEPNVPTKIEVLNIITSHSLTASSFTKDNLVDSLAGGYFQVSHVPTFSDPFWIKFNFNATYAINNLYQQTYYNDQFRCSDYDIDVSSNDLDYTKVIQKRGVNAPIYNDSFAETFGKYLKLTCYNRTSLKKGSWASWGEIKVNGRHLSVSERNYANATFNPKVSFLTDSSGTRVSLFWGYIGYTRFLRLSNISITGPHYFALFI